MAFINQTEEDNQATAPNEAAPVPASNASTGAAPMGSPTASPAAPKGSGRFTNIQKYISANQGASDRLAGGVNTKIQGQINPNLKKTEDNLSNIRQGIASGRSTLDQGNQINEQVQKADFDAQGFASNDDNVNKFTQFRTGQAIDENNLRNQAQTSQQQALAAQQKAQQLGQQFSTEQGRQQLLKQTFSPGRNYTTGQQRLDGLFLQQAAPQMKSIQGSIADANTKLGSLGSQLGTAFNDVNSLAEQEALLSGNLNTGIKNRESDLLSNVMGKQEAINNARMQSQKEAYDQFGYLRDGKSINSNFAKTLSLNEDDKLYNVLKQNANFDDYVKLNNTMLTSADQLADQQERAKYDAIARLAGIDPNNKQIKLDTKVANAVDSTGLLRSSLDQAKAKFQKDIQDKNVIGRASMREADLNVGESLSTIDKLRDELDAAKKADLRYLTNSNSIVDHSTGLTEAQKLAKNHRYQTGLTGTIGLTPAGVGYADKGAGLNALLNAYQDVIDRGYYQDVNIKDPTQESDGSFKVT